MAREDNVAVFEDTMRICRDNPGIVARIESSIKAQKLILEKDELLTPSLDKFAERAKVIVSKKRTLEAASAYREYKTVAHNFASASNPGGGVSSGANAQEECLCRISGLYPCLNVKQMWDGFYGPHRATHDPIHNDDIIYTPNVPVFKSDTSSPVLLKESDRYSVDIITCAAPNLRDVPSNHYNSGDGDKSVKVGDKELLDIHKKRLKRILDVSVAQGAEVIILGAFGCGAFMNKPEIVARAAKETIADYLNAFRMIEFAVYCSPRDDTNYRVFDRVLGKI